MMQQIQKTSPVQYAAWLADQKKAENIVILDVAKLTSYADHLVICSANNSRQVQAIARHIEDELKERGILPQGIEGLELGHWVLMDFGDFIVHVFLDSIRAYYDLEGFWADAPRVALTATQREAPAQNQMG